MFAALGDPVKRRILELIHSEELCVNELVQALGASQPAISKHLRTLRLASLVDVRIDGQRRFYRLREGALDGLADWLDVLIGHRDSVGV